MKRKNINDINVVSLNTDDINVVSLNRVNTSLLKTFLQMPSTSFRAFVDLFLKGFHLYLCVFMYACVCEPWMSRYPERLEEGSPGAGVTGVSLLTSLLGTDRRSSGRTVSALSCRATFLVLIF